MGTGNTGDTANGGNNTTVTPETGNDAVQAQAAAKKFAKSKPVSFAVRKSGKKVKLSWKKTADANGYQIFQKTGNGKWKKVKTIKKVKTVKFTSGKLKKGKKYSFRIRAYAKIGNKTVYSRYSAVKSIKIK